MTQGDTLREDGRLRGEVRAGVRRGEPGCGRRPRREEAGYTLMLVLFFAAAMIVAASAVVPNLILQGRRREEKLMIWRGQQYARAIGLFYRRTGHFPQDLKQLEKPVNGVYVLRKAYQDPMNTREDGAWRLIYLGPGGAFLGSLRWRTLAEYQAYLKGVPLPGSGGGTRGGANGSAPGQGGGSTAQEPIGSPLPQTHVIREGDMIGGNLIGVGSLVRGKSVKVYMGADNYREWEFIWNPLQGQNTTGAPVRPATGTPPQASPFSLFPTKPQVPQDNQQP